MKRSHKKRTKDLWNTRRKIQIQTELDQPSRKNGQHQTSETRPQLQTSGEKRWWMPQEKMAMRRCWNRSNDLIHGGRWWWWNSNVLFSNAYISRPACLFPLLLIFYFIFVKENVCKAVQNSFCLHEISHLYHIFTTSPCCNCWLTKWSFIHNTVHRYDDWSVFIPNFWCHYL